MAINTLAAATLFMTMLDKVAVQEATTGWMDANAGRVIYNGGNEVKIPKMSLQGMGDYDRDKLKASTIGKLENKYRQNIMNLVEDMPSLSVMLTIIQAAMEPWEHGIDYPDIQKIYDSWTEEGGNQVDLFKKVVIPTLVVSGFFPEKQAQSIMEELENQ